MTARKTKPRKGKISELPKGYTSIGGFGSNWPGEDTKPGQAISGVVVEYDSIIVTRKRGGKNVQEEVHNLKLETEDGTMFTVWESATLKALFTEDYTDMEVWLRYDGLGKKKRGQNPAKLFNIAYNE